MGLNLIDMAKQALTSQVLGKASEFLGEDSDKLSKGFGAAIPSILGSIVAKSSDTSGAGNLLGMLKDGGFDGGMMDNLGDVFGGGAATSGAIDSGGGLLKMFLGDKIGGVADLVSKASGIGSGSSSKLLSLAAPMIMSMIGRVVKTKALDAIGLGKLMGSQKSFIGSALPSGMGNLLGLGNLLGGAKDAISDTVGVVGDTAKSTVNAAANTTKEVAKAGSSAISKYLIPLAVLIGLFTAWQKGCFSQVADTAMDATSSVVDAAKDGMDKVGDIATDAATTVGDIATDAATTVGDAAGSMSDAVVGAATKALEGVSFVTGSVGDKFSKFLATGGTGDGSFQFSNLNFASGSGTIEGETTEIENLAAVLKAYPSVAITINGYTDSQGDDNTNQALSELRANTVLQQLIANGVDASRLSATGFGEANPVGDNSTAEGRAMNRRIEIAVTSK